MLTTIIIIGSLFVLWRFFVWGKKGYPMSVKKLLRPNFFISLAGVLLMVGLIIVYGQSNPNFSWGLILFGTIGGILISVIEAFSYDEKLASETR
jgi:hypothetical protein